MSEILNQRYHTAVKGGNIEEAKKIIDELLASGVNLNSRPHKRQTTYLTYAIRYNQPEIVEYLLGKGVDVNLPDKLYTPLLFACVEKNKTIVKLLLEHGADPNLASPYQGVPFKPIHLAIGKDQLDIVKLLVQAGLNLNDNEFQLPLSLAIEEKKVPIFDYLLAAGANVNAKGSSRGPEKLQFQPLIAAIHFKDTNSVLKLISAGANVNTTFDGWSALQYAVNGGTSEMVKALCEKGAEVNYRTPGKYFTALILSVIRKPISLDIMRILCEYGADTNIRTYQNQTAYSYAQQIDDEAIMNEVMNILLYCSVSDPKAVNASYLNQGTKNNPGKVQVDMEELNQRMYHAIENGDLKKVKEAIAYGADVGDNKYEPLVKAAYFGNVELFKYLFSIAYLPLDKTGSDKDFIYKLMGMARDNVEMFKYIEKKSGRNAKFLIFNILQFDIIKRYNRVAAYILSSYPQFNSQNFITTLISLAAQYSNEEALRMLMELDAVNIDDLGEVVKNFARWGDLHMLKYFKEKGFNFKLIGDDLWKVGYGKPEIEAFLEELQLPRPKNLKILNNYSANNNTQEGGKRRTRKRSSTRRKSNNHST